MRLNWHDHKVSIPMVEKWLKDTLGSEYQGNMALNDGFKIALDYSVDQSQRDEIQAYWDSLDSESDEAQNYRSAEWFETKKKQIEDEALVKPMDTWSILERKVMLKLGVSPLELLGIE